MENVLIEDSSLNEYFKIEYENQNLNDDISYLKWKNSMVNLKGNDTKFLKCKKDNIIFACTKKSLIEHPVYQSTCPVCKNNICYYCSTYFNDYVNYGGCCIKRKIYCMFLWDGFRYINDFEIVPDNTLFYSKALTFFIIPGYSLFIFILVIHLTFFYDLKKTNNNQSDTYRSFKRDCSFHLFLAINIAFNAMLTVPFIVLNIYFIVLLLIISLPFKKYPLKYFLGIGYASYY